MHAIGSSILSKTYLELSDDGDPLLGSSYIHI